MPPALSEQVSSDQAGHLDHFDFGLLMLMNFMFGSAWFGVYLNSGGAVHAMKELEAAEYAPFKKQLFEVPSAVHKGKLLVDGMQGPNGK